MKNKIIRILPSDNFFVYNLIKEFIMNLFQKKPMFYSFELLLAGIILLTAMTAGGISLWLKRRNEKIEQLKQSENEEQNNQNPP